MAFAGGRGDRAGRLAEGAIIKRSSGGGNGLALDWTRGDDRRQSECRLQGADSGNRNAGSRERTPAIGMQAPGSGLRQSECRVYK
jgi:hypothetical protein